MISGRRSSNVSSKVSRDYSSDWEPTIEPEKPKLHYWHLFKYASKVELLLFSIGVLMSGLVGSSMPISFFLFSDLVNDFLDHFGLGKLPLDRLINQFAILGGITFVVAFFQMLCLQIAAKRQAKRLRHLLFTRILQQDVPWFDDQNVGALITKITEGIDKIEAGIGVKLGIFLQCILIFVSGIIIGFTKNWELSLVACAIFPPIVFGFSTLGFFTRKFTVKLQKAYERANSIAGEALGAIRTIFAFEGQKTELKRYSNELADAEKAGITMSSIVSGVYGIADASIYILISVTFYYGIIMLNENRSNPGDIVMVVFTMLIGAITIGQSFQQLDHFNTAVTSAGEIFPIIDRVPPINKTTGGKRIDSFKGEIQFNSISFTYPMRPDVKVLTNFNLQIAPGKTIAIVGPSGSGKSTVIQLIQRFYDAEAGKVLIDGIDIKELDLPWFRSQLGVVSQEPVLFAGTVAENIRLGAKEATDEQIEEAAKMARAHDFVCKLPEAYGTFIAEGGGGMSGGQKQRLAIARALVRNPRILLLDEATSALDTKSEKSVQRALDNAKVGRTVVMVAHRLSTVRDADTIIVVDKGCVVESGTHNELLKIEGGVYANLVKSSTNLENSKGPSDSDDENEYKHDDDDEDDDVANVLKVAGKSKEESITDKGSLSGSDEELQKRRSIHSDLSSVSFNTDKEEEKPKINVTKEILRLNSPETCYIVVGIVLSIINGLVQASFAVLITEIYSIFAVFNAQTRLDRAAVLSGVLGLMGALRLICLAAGGYVWGVSGSRLTTRCRKLLFEAMMNQEVGWFDESDNQPGTLTGSLAADVPTLQNISGKSIASMFEVLVLVIASLVIAFYYSWQVALVALAYFPVLIIVGAFNMKQWTGGNEAGSSVKGAGLVHECLSAAKTVFSLGAEDLFVDRFVTESLPTDKKINLESCGYAFFSALANSLSAFQIAGVFYAGGRLMEQGVVSMVGVFRAYTAISFAAQQLGFVASFAPDSKKAGKAAESIFATIRRAPILLPDEGEFPSKPFEGEVTFNNLHFRYPTRKKIPVLKGFEYNVKSGKSVALVGQSGCGKSTLLQLVQRFYDPTGPSRADAGILFDGLNLRSLAPAWIRRQIGVVSQEPNLLDMTIRENIAYGMTYASDADVPSMDDIIEAAKQANAHNFIMDLPEGYDTPVGPRGSQLSGGQKQRVAIARALVRNPRLLVLDEATAALDNESERVVQAALDAAMKAGGRTTLVVAHRLSTVENCDVIVVLENGKQVESGDPVSLMEAKGAYYSLHCTDTHGKID